MSFDTETLSYKAYTYNCRSAPLKITDESLKLVKQSDGKYGVKDSDILVKIHAAALNPVDLILTQLAFFPLARGGPFGFGRDYSGTVVAIGDKARAKSKLQVGDKVCGNYGRVFGQGTLAEYLLLDYDANSDVEITVTPKNQSLNEAAAWPLVLGTALQMTGYDDLKGKKILVIGASSSVGKYIVQLAKYKGAKEVVGVASGHAAPSVTGLGATSIIDYTQHKSLLNPVLDSVKDSGSFDDIFDAIGNGDLFAQIGTIIKPKGNYVTIVGEKPLTYKAVDMVGSILPQIRDTWRQLSSKLGISHYNYSKFLLAHGPKWIDEAKRLFEEGVVEVHIDSVYDWEDAQKAIDKLASKKTKGKVIVQVEK